MKVRRLSQEATDLIKYFEGFRSHVYYCSGGKLTIGYGHVVRPGESFPNGITEEEGESLLLQDLIIARLGVQKYIRTFLTDGMYGALTSFTFNLGAGALQRSTLRTTINYKEYEEAADQFPRWVYAGGRKLRGLILRREAERALFLSEGYPI